VVLIGGGLILIDILADTRDASPEPRVRDGHA